MTDEKSQTAGEASFCLPRETIHALLEAQASAHEICALLTLARATDVTGCYTRASVSSVNDATGSFKGKIKSALTRLTQIHAKRKVTVMSDGVEVVETEDLGPILWSREEWMSRFGGPIPDNNRYPTTYVLSNFGEALFDRVWFSSNLVGGYKEFKQPLKCLRDLGDSAARLLLLIHATSDMENWGGACPVGDWPAPWQPYKTTYIKTATTSTAYSTTSKTGKWRWEATDLRIDPTEQYRVNALNGLLTSGLVYEVVTVMNREFIQATFNERSYETRPEIDEDAQPLYELHTGTSRANPPFGEEGHARSIAEIAQALGQPIWDESGKLDHTYGVLSLLGQPIGVIGILRPRFRVRNHRNAGVSDAWNRIRQSQASALLMIQNVRLSLGLEPHASAGGTDGVGDSRTSKEAAGHIPINTNQSSTNKYQSKQREKRKHGKPRDSGGVDWEMERRRSL